MIHNFTTTINNDISDLSVNADNREQILIDNPIYKVHDPAANDIGLALKIAREMIHVNGAHINIHTRTFNNDVDQVWDEDPDPTYYLPKSFDGFFVPEPLERELTKWGLDLSNKTEVIFNRQEIYNSFYDRLLKPGDLLELPYNSQTQDKPKYYRVENSQETGNYRYQWLYITCQVILLTGDITVRPHTDKNLNVVEYNDEVGGRSGAT